MEEYGPSGTGSQEEEEREKQGKKQEEEEEQSLLFQMERKYFCKEDDGQSTKEAYIIDMFGNSPCKAAHERLLELLVLDNLGICRIGQVQRLSQLAKKVAELDLSCNMLDWPSVGKLFLALPQLRTLNLSQNVELSRPGAALELPTAPKLRTLILNGLCLPLASLHQIVQCAPSLRELHLSKSKGQFPDLDGSSNFAPISDTLDELHLNDCGLEGWCQVLALLRLFPSVESLFLADNPLALVQRECQCGWQTAQLATRMKGLSLSNTRISSWESIENLEAIGHLEELRVAHIPLLEDYSMEERVHLMVGRLPSLRILNGSAIDARQREDSERFFIRYYSGAEKKPLVYEQLVAEHGMLEQLVKVDLTPKKYAKVAIHCEETDWVRLWIRLRLNGSTVQKLMKFAEELTKIPFRSMRIFYVDKNVGQPWPLELRFPNQQLKMLHIEDGDEFFVQSKLVLNQRTSMLAKNQQKAANAQPSKSDAEKT